MRILQLIQKPQLRGAEIFACQLSNHLERMGNQVIVVSIYQGDADLPFLGKIINLNRSISQRFFDFKGWKAFNKIIKDFKPDIVQANAADTLKFAVSSKKIFSWSQPIIYRNANKMGDFITSKFKYLLNKYYISKVDYVISVSKECELDFIKIFGFPTNKISTVEIGVEEKQVGKKPIDLVDIFDIGPVITHIGGFVPEKNHIGLMRIMEPLIKKKPSFQILLLGKGELEDSVKELVFKMGIQNNVHFLGYRADVLEIISNSKAFVLPSLIEGLPAVILESMYCETPVVSYNVGGIGEVVINNKTGWIFEKNDEQNFRKAIDEILTSNSTILSEVTNAKELVTEKFLNTQITKRFSNVYESIL
ncbi:glycosyltransferase [Gillisia sp. JM1]|uniref:glycosyltransferase n=1 Tax=Gillisia sp. JM1 TaxID=1283286 RepID=UPI0003FC89AA|nr:glycosyltransferase [Gillisia sp. JM1]